MARRCSSTAPLSASTQSTADRGVAYGRPRPAPLRRREQGQRADRRRAAAGRPTSGASALGSGARDDRVRSGGCSRSRRALLRNPERPGLLHGVQRDADRKNVCEEARGASRGPNPGVRESCIVALDLLQRRRAVRGQPIGAGANVGPIRVARHSRWRQWMRGGKAGDRSRAARLRPPQHLPTALASEG